MEKNQPTTSRIVAHPDKVEVRFPSTERNCELLTAHLYDNLMRTWSLRHHFDWMDKRKIFDQHGRWKAWEIVGVSDELQINVGGWAYHLSEDYGRIRLFDDPGWWENPFPTTRELEHYYWRNGFRHVGWLRVTDPVKNTPEVYTKAVTQILLDIEALGVEEQPHEIEIALDAYEERAADLLRRHARLKGGQDLKVSHSKPNLFRQNRFPRPSPDGDWEYQQREVYTRRRLRDLFCYPRRDHGFYRTELRFGSAFLNKYYGSPSFAKAYSTALGDPWEFINSDRPSFSGQTLKILETIESLVKNNLILETLDVERIDREHAPGSRFWKLSGLSVRGQRYTLRQVGLTNTDIARYASSIALPKIQFLRPGGF